MDGNDKLRDLFHQLEPADADASVAEELRKEVFTSLDGVQLLATIIDLFTSQFAASTSLIWEAVQQNDYWDEEAKLLDYYNKRLEKPSDETEDGL
jgi:predicted regulator of amino acid metabolism with ACT domain